jgi:LysR family glycine cleavage system transcriptional activator
MRRLPPLGALRAFEAAARLLSFKKAADELNLTSTAISHHVRLLEDYCGRKLFRRRPRPLVLTDVGARLYPPLRDGFDAFSAAFSLIDPKADAQPFRVTTTNAFASRWLVPRLGRWRSTHEDISLSVNGTDRVLKPDGDEADLALRYSRSPPRGASSEIFRDQYYPVCSPKLLAGEPVSSAMDLCRYPLIRYDWSSDDRSSPNWERWFEAASPDDPSVRLRCKIALSFRGELHAIEAALAGQGVALCSDIVLADDLVAGNLVKALDVGLPGYGFYPLYEPGHPRRSIIENFVEWLRALALESHPDRPPAAQAAGP